MIIVSGRSNGLRFPGKYVRNDMTNAGVSAGQVVPGDTFVGRDPILAAASTLFHITIFAAPLSSQAHAILFDLSWDVKLPLISPSVTSLFTSAAIASGIFLVLRRTLIRRVRAVTGWRDYAAMTCVLVPFVTGLLAREMVGSYELVMIIHLVGAHLLLLALGWTRLGHMVFFITGRIAVSVSGSGKV